MTRSMLAALLALLIPAGLRSQAPATAPAETPADSRYYAVAYIETMAAANRAATAALHTYRDDSMKTAGCLAVEIFEQVGRPGHWTLVETWRDQKAFDARPAGLAQQLTEALRPIRVSDYDQRPYKTLSVDSRTSGSSGAQAVIVVAHVDVTPGPQAPVILKRLADASRREAGNLRFDVYQHTMRANHFTVVETWRDQRALDAHVAEAHTKQYRDEIQPLTGSPLDERVYTALK